jgi:hypothetical protein
VVQVVYIPKQYDLKMCGGQRCGSIHVHLPHEIEIINLTLWLSYPGNIAPDISCMGVQMHQPKKKELLHLICYYSHYHC